MPKRYYWLKLQEDFFSSPKIKKLRRIAGGDTFTIIYLKMQLLSVKNGGVIVYQGIEETFEEELSLVLDEDTDNVKMTLSFLYSQGLIEQSDDKTFLLSQAANNIGSESESAARVRNFRKKALHCNEGCNASVTPCNENVTTDIDKDREKEKERDGDESAALSAVMTAYLDRVNPNASQRSLEELKAYAEQMGSACCLRAIDIALDERKANWSYIRGILRAKLSAGVRCIADWDRLEQEREGKRHGTVEHSDGTFHGWKARSALDEPD